MTNGADEEAAAENQPGEAAGNQPNEAAEPTQPAEGTEVPAPPRGEAAASGAPPSRGGWVVPKWFVAALVGFVAFAIIFGSAFAIGRATASGDGGEHGRNERGFEGRPGRGNGNGPQLPQPTSGVFLGVSTGNATGGQQGAQVENVANGSPAAGAGLQAGDVINAVDRTAVSSAAHLAPLGRSHQPGDQVTITYTRGGNSTEAPGQLGDRPAQNAPAS